LPSLEERIMLLVDVYQECDKQQ